MVGAAFYLNEEQYQAHLTHVAHTNAMCGGPPLGASATDIYRAELKHPHCFGVGKSSDKEKSGSSSQSTYYGSGSSSKGESVKMNVTNSEQSQQKSRNSCLKIVGIGALAAGGIVASGFTFMLATSIINEYSYTKDWGATKEYFVSAAKKDWQKVKDYLAPLVGKNGKVIEQKAVVAEKRLPFPRVTPRGKKVLVAPRNGATTKVEMKDYQPIRPAITNDALDPLQKISNWLNDNPVKKKTIKRVEPHGKKVRVASLERVATIQVEMKDYQPIRPAITNDALDPLQKISNWLNDNPVKKKTIKRVEPHGKKVRVVSPKNGGTTKVEVKDYQPTRPAITNASSNLSKTFG